MPAKGWAGALARLQLTRACPGLLGAGGGGWGVGEGLLVGRTSRSHVLGDRKPVTAAAATMSCVYCVDIWRRAGPLPRTRGPAAGVWPALARGEACSELTSCAGWWVAGRPAGCKADRLCDPQLPVRPCPGHSMQEGQARRHPLATATASTAAPNTMESQRFARKSKSEVT